MNSIKQLFGFDSYECIFDLAPEQLSERYLLIMGLYPPPGSDASKPRDNRTSRDIAGVMQNYNFAWNDLFPIAPSGGETCTSLNSAGMLKALDDHITKRTPQGYELIKQWNDRLEAFVERQHELGNFEPAVVWCGQIVNKARKWMEDIDLAVSDAMFQIAGSSLCLSRESNKGLGGL